MSQDPNNFNQQHQPQIIVKESQAVAALVAIFLGGIGQLVQGRIAAGLLWIVAYILGIISTIVSLGLGGIFLFIAWILCIVDAAIYKPGISAPIGKLVFVGLVLNSIMFIIVIGLLTISFTQ